LLVPSIDIRPNYANLAQYGISPANLQYQLQTALEGNVVGTVYDKDQLSDIRMIYPGNRTLSVDEISKLQIFLPNGQLKPIASFADVKINPGDAEIQRENLQSMGVVTARLDSLDLGTVINEIQKQVASKIALPKGYSITYGGAYAEQQKSFNELLIILITSSLLVFGVILFLFKDFIVSFIILSIAVLGIAGSYAGLYFTGYTPQCWQLYRSHYDRWYHW
jgi:Cu/Ag efflux pump CusA